MAGAGFFGKLPALGDFVSRRVNDDYLETWDSWLQQGIAESRETLGERWTEIYLESPIWRFALPAGYAGKTPCCGVMMPSVDRVGRKFPLTVVSAIVDAPPTVVLMSTAAEFFSAAEALALDALDARDFVLNDFDNAVAALNVPIGADKRGANATEDGVAWMFELPFDQDLESNIPALLGDAAVDELDGLGLWWTLGSDRVAPCLLVSGSLPDGSGYVPMLNGAWDLGYWQEVTLRADIEKADEQDGQQEENPTP